MKIYQIDGVDKKGRCHTLYHESDSYVEAYTWAAWIFGYDKLEVSFICDGGYEELERRKKYEELIRSERKIQYDH